MLAACRDMPNFSPTAWATPFGDCSTRSRINCLTCSPRARVPAIVLLRALISIGKSTGIYCQFACVYCQFVAPAGTRSVLWESREQAPRGRRRTGFDRLISPAVPSGLKSARGAPGHPWPRAAHTTRSNPVRLRPRYEVGWDIEARTGGLRSFRRRRPGRLPSPPGNRVPPAGCRGRRCSDRGSGAGRC